MVGEKVTVAESTVGSSASVKHWIGWLTKITRKNPTMVAGIVFVVVIAFITTAAPLFTTLDPNRLAPADRLQAPSADHWFGTDQVGRDLYSRTVYGGRISLIVGFSVAALTVTLGAVIGLVAGYFRKVDAIVMRLLDGLMAFPMVLLAIALVAILGSNMVNVIIALVVVSFPREVRVVRASVLSLREQQFVEAARAIGAPVWRILALHIFPSTLPPLIVQGTFTISIAILTEAILSFLGAGISPHIPTWGNMMSEGNYYVQVAVWAILFPGIALGLTVMGISLAGDGLRDLLDPRISRS
ncbi:ABC transporter permease [Dehalococcoidia bacterium]|nr:ABC transporter permease [Dehalococcoidia bacterium]